MDAFNSSWVSPGVCAGSPAMRVSQVAEAEWMLADACELAALREANVQDMDVVVAATGDDKANLVISFLAKTEFAVPRTVARVNNPRNEWMYDAQWGVDVAVSTPRIMTAMVEEAVAVGDLVKVFSFHQSGASIVEVTLPKTSPVVGAIRSATVLTASTVPKAEPFSICSPSSGSSTKTISPNSS